MSHTINILAVDDNPEVLELLQLMIQEKFDHVNVIKADSGLSALSLLIKMPVDLIFLDIHMPQMDGFETAKIIQSRPNTQHVPVVFLTAVYKSEQFMKKGFDLGAVDYLTKPIDFKQLTDKVEIYLRFIKKSHSNPKHRIERQVLEHIAKLPQTQEIIEHERLEVLRQALQSAFNAIIECSEMLKEETTELGCDDCLPEIEQMDHEGRTLLNLLNNVLVPKLVKMEK